MKTRNNRRKSAKWMVAGCAAFVFAAQGAFAWGTGHETVARETLKLLQGEWGERLRAGEGGKTFLSAAHAPDDQKTLFTDRADYIDGILLSRLTPPNGKTPVMYRFHEADARCELILALSRAMRGGKDEAVGFLLACFNHSVADTVSANHSPLRPLVLELDAAGETVMESALEAVGLAETRGQVTARGE